MADAGGLGLLGGGIGDVSGAAADATGLGASSGFGGGSDLASLAGIDTSGAGGGGFGGGGFGGSGFTGSADPFATAGNNFMGYSDPTGSLGATAAMTGDFGAGAMDPSMIGNIGGSQGDTLPSGTYGGDQGTSGTTSGQGGGTPSGGGSAGTGMIANPAQLGAALLGGPSGSAAAGGGAGSWGVGSTPTVPGPTGLVDQGDLTDVTGTKGDLQQTVNEAAKGSYLNPTVDQLMAQPQAQSDSLQNLLNQQFAGQTGPGGSTAPMVPNYVSTTTEAPPTPGIPTTENQPMIGGSAGGAFPATQVTTTPISGADFNGSLIPGSVAPLGSAPGDLISDTPVTADTSSQTAGPGAPSGGDTTGGDQTAGNQGGNAQGGDQTSQQGGNQQAGQGGGNQQAGNRGNQGGPLGSLQRIASDLQTGNVQGLMRDLASLVQQFTAQRRAGTTNINVNNRQGTTPQQYAQWYQQQQQLGAQMAGIMTPQQYADMYAQQQQANGGDQGDQEDKGDQGDNRQADNSGYYNPPAMGAGTESGAGAESPLAPNNPRLPAQPLAPNTPPAAPAQPDLVAGPVSPGLIAQGAGQPAPDQTASAMPTVPNLPTPSASTVAGDVAAMQAGMNQAAQGGRAAPSASGQSVPPSRPQGPPAPPNAASPAQPVPPNQTGNMPPPDTQNRIGATPNIATPNHYAGTLTMPDGSKFRMGSGGGRFGALPYGRYYLHPGGVGPWGQAHGAVAGISDSRGGGDNTVHGGPNGHSFRGVEIHPAGGSQPRTLGCLGIDSSQWGAFRRAWNAAQSQGGQLILSVGPNGAQISIQNANPIANIRRRQSQIQPTSVAA